MPKITYYWDELSDNVAAEYEDGILSASYTHEPGLYGNLLSQKRNGVTSYYHYDGRGDTVALTDDSGDVTDTKEYDAWGNVIASTGTTVTPYQFCGRKVYQTGNTGVYVRARMYQPAVARWSSVDPLKFEDGMNQFMYAALNPLRFIDPTGLFCRSCCCCIAGVKITGIKKVDDPGSWGHEFDVDVDLKYVEWDKDEPADCTHEWWEKTNVPAIKGIKPDLWFDVCAVSPEHCLGWSKYREKPCPGAIRHQGSDAPQLSKRGFRTVQRKLYFALKYSSAKDCPCDGILSTTVYATQVLTIDSGIGVDPSWLRVGIDPKELEGIGK